MFDAKHPSQPGPSSPPSRQSQNKVVLQREYREKEVECFNVLRGVIKDVTGEEPRTRQEILKKAADLLSSFSETGNNEIRASTLSACHEVFNPPGHEDPTLVHLAYSAQSSSYWSQAYSVGIGLATPHHGTHVYNQQHSPMDSPLNQSSFPAYDSSPGYLQFRRFF